MKRISAALLLFWLAVGVLQAQQPESSWFMGKPVVGFQFQGLKQVTEGELLTLLSPYRNKPFSYDIYWEMQNKLYALEFFETVEADAIPGDPEKKSVIISFTVKERPLVSRIQFSGNNNMSEKELRDAVLIKERAVWSEAKVKMDVDAIKALYRNKGFLDADVTYTDKVNDIDGMVDLTFVIAEGPKTTVKKILFSGNTFASEGTLKGLMQTKEPALFANSDYQENKLKEDSDAIETYYSDHGYYFAKVEKVDKQIELNEAEQRKYIILTVYINEGAQYTYGATTFQGNNIFSTEKLAALFRQKTGDILSKKKYKEDFMKVVNLYYDNGYVTMQINSNEKVDEGKKVISFEITFVEGDRSHIGRIIIQGNTKTREAVIRRELPFEEGDVFNRAKIQRGYINLMRTGYFSRNLVFEPTPGIEEGLIDILITVEETPTANLEVGGSIVPGDFPFTAYANLVDKNFLGMGVTAGTNLNLTTTQQSLSGTYENNWMFGQRILGGINFSVKHELVQNVPIDWLVGPTFNGDEPNAFPDPFLSWEDYQNALDSGQGIPADYTMEYHNVEFRLGLAGGYSLDLPLGLLGFRIEPSSTLSYIYYDPASDRPFSNVLRDEWNRWILINRLGLTLFLNGTDVPQNPEKGFYLSQYVGFIGDFLLGDRHYIRLASEGEAYLKFFDIPVSDAWSFKIILAVHSDINFILPPLFRENEVTVEDDLFRVDGMFVGRGWYLRWRGKVLWDNKIELRMPIVQEVLWWTIFYVEAVGFWKEPSDFAAMKDSDFYWSAGTGLRLVIPGIPMRLYLAKRWKIVNGQIVPEEGALKFSDQFSLDLVFSVDINPF
ncbi:MAG: outer membrane protein assembly factor BamA [Spirochaetales bacterium]|nr:outer membrane protein assembly factor BamA [Spirochaetales bacterium]